ncbi:MAG: hypothetical protein J1E35_08545 [Lachnospiraceae bacterium]|nr:hypothetical protein [Lachnospiraceae bacterium]
MGLFSWFKGKKKKQKANDVRQAGISGNVADPAVRQAFYKECSELIDDAVLQSEQARNEYGLVTAYLSDVQKLELITGDSRAEIEEAAKNLLSLDSERERLGKQEPSISESQKAFLALHEEELPKTIQWLRGEEEYQRTIEGKMKYLAGEKAVYVMEHEECVNKNEFLKKLMIGVSVGVFLFLGLFFGIGNATEKDLQIPFLLTVMVGLIFAMYVLVTTRKNIYNMKVADIKRNKVIEVENRIKLRYVNCTWGIEYAYEKYHTTSSQQLETMWKEYLRIKAEEEQQRRNDRQREVYRSTIIRELRRYGVMDAGIWVLQPQALIDDKEMVEVRHSLNVRRQKLREHIDYNIKQKEKNEAAILRFVGEHPEYADEMKELFTRYRLLQKIK